MLFRKKKKYAIIKKWINWTFLNQIDTMTEPSIRRFYMPGHKGRGLSEIVLPKMDITEVEGADNLHHPQGVIAALQKKMVADYKTRASWPLVGGSTLGIQAALFGPGPGRR